MKIDCISDLHGFHPNLEGGDLLIVVGDLTAYDKAHQLLEFGNWITSQSYKKKIVIAGNHDNLIAAGRWQSCPPCEYGWDFDYLCDSGTEFEGLKIWGSPWTKRFPGMNPHCMAFTVDTDMELFEKWEQIPDDTDILITHSPAWGFGDKVERGDAIENVGSKSLTKWIANHAQSLKLHVCGHIHEGYGIYDVREAKKLCNDPIPSPILVNASHVNRSYKPVNKPIRVEL